MRIELDAFGDIQLRREILRWGDAAGDASPAFRSIMQKWTKGADRQFQTQGRRASGGWKPISDEWRRRKVAMGYDRRILHMTGLLRRSLTLPVGAQGIREIRPDRMTYGTSVPYAPFHQHGASEIRRQAWGKPTKPYRWTLARRRPIELTGGRSGDRAQAVRILQLWIARGVVR